MGNLLSNSGEYLLGMYCATDNEELILEGVKGISYKPDFYNRLPIDRVNKWWNFKKILENLALAKLRGYFLKDCRLI